ncbi:thioredoxin family protein [Pedobacter fastidiosus]|uniref:Thioredoxin family protein n=1 Tax=Pedobacter fastidiosus TaxID=2765361 RepID=A0ABR7KXT7_9SPHI|nr:thioredoxin family protein [Pedobacter fastidiosus]MBC6112828.1 thioredoxin family protein [Pedobacter fastidiosus]
MRKLLMLFFMIIPLQIFAVEFFKGTYAEALQKCKGENKLLFLDFTAVWCGPCHQMEREILNDVDVSALLDEKFVVIKIDIEEPENYYYTDKYIQSNGIPDYTILNANEEQIGKHHGACDKEVLMQFFNGVLNFEKPNAVNINTKIEKYKLAYEKEKSYGALYIYINNLLKYKQNDKLAFELYRKYIANVKSIKNYVLLIPSLFAQYYGQENKAEAYANMVRFIKQVDKNNEIENKLNLIAYFYYSSSNDLQNSKKYLTNYLNIIENQDWIEASTKIGYIKKNTYLYKDYKWGISALKEFRVNYAKAFSNKERVPITGYYYQLAVMNFLDGNIKKAKEMASLYDAEKNKQSHTSIFKTEDQQWLKRIREAD